ncbi:hypothetical protein [Streptomyces sp. BBFR109]|uniref:hypothetical protein n=1 Tax=Streptomyces sp. BBFR109 TaxID=3448172 RepID=UPI003F7686A1
MASPAHRFLDPRSTEYDFIGLIIVRCPGCAKAALPAWVKRAKNRDEILRAVSRSHASLVAA